MNRLLTALVATVALTVPALAQQPSCAPRKAFVDHISGGQWQEQQVAVFVAEGGIVEVHGNPETGTWTILSVMPSGTACHMASGEGFELLTPDPPEPGEPS